MSKYYSINEFSKILGVSAQTLRNWDKNGKLHPHHTSSNGYRYYSQEQLNQVMNIKPNLDRITIGYCRVSSNKQKDDLERQIENMKLYLTAQGKPFEIISDIGSGINYKKDLLMSKYYSINEFSKILGVSAQTLRNWDKNGKLHPHHTSSNGYRYYSQEQLNQVMNIKPNLDRITIGYCRVSSNKQKDDLERQIENMKLYLTAQGKPFEIISDIGSGINYKKKGLKELIN